MAVPCVDQKAGQPFFAPLWSDFHIAIRDSQRELAVRMMAFV
jgi:hypothetical protein